MAFATDDLELYGSQVMPEDDVTTAIGGAIDLTTRVSFTPMGVNGGVEVISDTAGDCLNITLTGRDATGPCKVRTGTAPGAAIVPGPGRLTRA